MTALETAKAAAALLDEKKATRISIIKIDDISSLADYFVIANGGNTTHVHSLSDALEEKLKESGTEPLRIEGYRSNSWILLDYGSVVVHIFTQDARDFYDLDRLWADGEKISF